MCLDPILNSMVLIQLSCNYGFGPITPFLELLNKVITLLNSREFTFE